jgi:oxygen-dependent protoporphyrinogen oxidase
VANSDSQSIAVLGAGATGLTAALRLGEAGHRVRLFEAGPRVGGAVRTEQVDGWLIEGGPNSVLTGEPALTRLIERLGLAGEVVPANAVAKNRFIVRGGRALPTPSSGGSFFRTPLFSFGAKVRLLSEIFCRARVRTSDLSLEEFVRSHVGQELVDYGLNPFVGGVYAGNPKKLSARHSFPQLWEMEQKHGSLIRGALAGGKARKARGEPRGGMISFREGLQTLPNAIAARLPSGTLTLNARIEALIPGAPSFIPSVPSVPSSASWNLIWHDGTATHTESFDAIVAALPAPALAQLRFGTHGERPLASLDAIDHPPVASLFLGYHRAQVAHPLDGFGVLAPAIENRSVLGVLFSSSLFPGRAPAGHVALTVMVGGARQPELARLPPDQLLAAVDRDLRELLGVAGTPVFQRHTFWPRAIPQYNLGYEAHLATMAACERTHPGLFIGGQARDGIALPACLAAGEKLATRAGA